MSNAIPPPPGWYDDPDDPTASRWWTGSSWGPRSISREGPVVELDSRPPPPTGDPSQVPMASSELQLDSPSAREDALAKAWRLRQEAMQVAGQLNASSAQDRERLRREYADLIEQANAVKVEPAIRAPGWFSDPRDDNRLRWWDGSAWSDEEGRTAPEATEQTHNVAMLYANSSKPLSEKEEKELSQIPFSMPGLFGVILTAIIIGFGVGALNRWLAIGLGVIVFSILIRLHDLTTRSATAPNPLLKEHELIYGFVGAFSLAFLLSVAGSSVSPSSDNDADRFTGDVLGLPDNETGAIQEQDGSDSPIGEPDTDKSPPNDASADSPNNQVDEGTNEDDAPAGPQTLAEKVNLSLSRPNRDVTFLTSEPNRRAVILEDGSNVLVMVALNDSLSNRAIRRAAQADTVSIAQVVERYEPFEGTLTISMYFPLVDRFGNSEETAVATVSYTRETLDRINFSNLLPTNIWEVADEKALHPVFAD